MAQQLVDDNGITDVIDDNAVVDFVDDEGNFFGNPSSGDGTVTVRYVHHLRSA